MNYFEIDFCGDILYKARTLMRSHLSNNKIISELLKDYLNEDMDIIDEIGVYGMINYISHMLEVDNQDLRSKMDTIESRLTFLKKEYPSKFNYAISLHESFHNESPIIERFFRESDSISSSTMASFEPKTTFKLKKEKFNIPQTFDYYFVHVDNFEFDKENLSLGYLVYVHVKDISFQNPQYIKHGIFQLDYLQKISGKQDVLDIFENKEMVVTKDGKILRVEIALDINYLIQKGYFEYFGLVKLDLPITSKFKNRQHVFIYSSKFFTNSVTKFINKELSNDN